MEKGRTAAVRQLNERRGCWRREGELEEVDKVMVV